MPTNADVFGRNLTQGARKFVILFPAVVERRVRPLIEAELKEAPKRTGRLLESRYIRVRRYPGRVCFTFGYTAFYARFTGADERLASFKQSPRLRRALLSALREALRQSFGSGARARVTFS